MTSSCNYFKVGDIVTPDEKVIKENRIRKSDEIYSGIGKSFRIAQIHVNGGISFDRPIGDNSASVCYYDRYFKLDKRSLVQDILKDL